MVVNCPPLDLVPQRGTSQLPCFVGVRSWSFVTFCTAADSCPASPEELSNGLSVEIRLTAEDEAAGDMDRRICPVSIPEAALLASGECSGLVARLCDTEPCADESARERSGAVDPVSMDGILLPVWSWRVIGATPGISLPLRSGDGMDCRLKGSVCKARHGDTVFVGVTSDERCLGILLRVKVLVRRDWLLWLTTSELGSSDAELCPRSVEDDTVADL
jgi:hypothetical protein